MRVHNRVREEFLAWLRKNRSRAIREFRRDGWNEKLYSSLAEDSVRSALIFGGHTGAMLHRWIESQREATFHVFEPVPRFADELFRNFPNQNVVVHRVAVGRVAGTRSFVISGDSTRSAALSQVSAQLESETVDVEFKDVDYLRPILTHGVQLVEMNIEGGEYELIHLLADTGLLENITNLFIQFHDIGPKTMAEIESCRKRLQVSHEQIWSYEMVWEYWKKR